MSKCYTDIFGTKIWKNDKGEYHREDGPCYEDTYGSKSWCINGIRHREDGPAIEWTNDKKAWFYHGKPIDCNSQEEFLRIIKMKAFW